ncbi:MAG: hypothetical protein PWQ12_1568 [Clostridiales bacterium]|nr:hypothetical protein [Clostridiales bacterium]
MEDKRKLHILWTNGDINTSLHMVMMYATNAMLRGWWDEVKVIIWGAPAKLVAENKEIQERIELAKRSGVEFSACIACARELGVLEDLEKLNIEVISWGAPLTELIQSKASLITV